MRIVIPIKGNGTRFRDYNNKKPFIKTAPGKTMLEECAEPFLEHGIKVDIICNSEDRKTVQKLFGDKVNKVLIEKETKGAGDTIKIYCEKTEESPFTVVDCDTILDKEGALAVFGMSNTNFIGTFTEETISGAYSYFKEGDEDVLHEKVAVSNKACAGVYGFSSKKIYLDSYRPDKTALGEVYISSVVNTANKKDRFTTIDLSDSFSCVGTPQQMMKRDKKEGNQKIYVFDLDKTLVRDFVNDRTPIEENVLFCKKVFSLGHHVIIHTSRGMISCGKDVEKIKEKYKKDIEKWLRENKILHDELVFGKPYGDYYIDDKAIDSLSDLYLETNIEKDIQIRERAGKELKIDSGKVYKKSKESFAQFCFYVDVPGPYCKYFPKHITYTDEVLIMDHIKGDTYSNKIVNMEFSHEDLHNILTVVLEWCMDDTGAYYDKDFYNKKLQDRYERNTEFYEILGVDKQDLEKVKDAQVYGTSFTHGDTVLTNIIETNTIPKFIDPRGKFWGGYCSTGPNCYDLAKLLQSLFGYDHILANEQKPECYLEGLREQFYKTLKENKISTKHIILKTASLVLSMIPLHQDNMINCRKFVEMFHEIIKEYENRK